MRETFNASPLARQGLPLLREPMMVGRRERAALAAMDKLKRIGANPQPTHFLPSGLPFVAPETGRMHGPVRSPVAPLRLGRSIQRGHPVRMPLDCRTLPVSGTEGNA
jgi:hypothetical protein